MAFVVAGTTVVADKRRGKLSLVQTPEDGLLHLQWVQRPSGQLQETDDILLMPRSAFLEKVPECKVSTLPFKRRFFPLCSDAVHCSDAVGAVVLT